jgi:hypothetical protein
MRPRALVATASFIFAIVTVSACGPAKEPKQVSPADPTTDDTSGGSGDTSGSGSGSSSSKSGSGDIIVPPPSGGSGSTGPVGKSPKGEAPLVGSLATYQEGLRWGMSHADVNKAFTETEGFIAKDYNERLVKARVGPEQTAIEAERERQKAAFTRSFVEFKDQPTGYDATGIKGEYTYKNRESLMWVQRQGKKRYFFFINDRLWKVYDEVPLADSGALGKSYLDAVNSLNGKLGVQGRVLGANPDKGINATTVDWKDNSSHFRAVDRSGSDHVVGLALEDLNTLATLASLRSNKPDDPNAIDPSVAAVTKGGLSDPNAPSSSGSATPKGGKAPKK